MSLLIDRFLIMLSGPCKRFTGIRTRIEPGPAKHDMTDIPCFRILVWCVAVASCLYSCASVSTESVQKASAHYQMGLSLLNDNNIQPAFVEFQKALNSIPMIRKC